MAFDSQLADRIRAYLAHYPALEVEEKKMFGGLAFMINGKMCVNASGENLMCRFDPKLQDELAQKNGFQLMEMKGRVYKGYCYVEPKGFKTDEDFTFWLELCLAFNERAKSSKN